MNQRTAPTVAKKKRMMPEQRRQQLLEVAAELLSDQGLDSVQMTELASAAGVTRPVVYRFFPNRVSLLLGLLADFEEEVHRRFNQVSLPEQQGDITGMAQAFIEALCEAIEAKGAGAWFLMDSRGPAPEIAEAGREALTRLLIPWEGHIEATTGATKKEMMAITTMLMASGKAAIGLWLDGRLTREEAITAAAKGIGALLTAFSTRQE